ncbi:phage adaptor protein [Phyllobacterium sp. 22229]|uniref:phage adaptor protein n=1 Tax=Phyllobacterium sp. 22229 TaxID=3453895 RepID=UPI003F86D94C
MSLITSVNAACDVVSLDRFDTVYGNNNPNAQTMIEFAQEAGEEIVRRVDWEKTLKTAIVPSSPYALDENFQRLITGGAVTTAAGEFVRPVTNGSEWTVINQVPSSQPYCFIRGGKMLFSPAIAGVGAIIEYVSRNWILAGTDEKSKFTADDNTFLFPERLLTMGLIWRWKRQKGLTYDDHLAEFEAALAFEIAADLGASQ